MQKITDNKPIDFIEEKKRLGLKPGELFHYPVDDACIYAYNITVEEMTPYMTLKYRHVHCSDILDMILENRKNKEKKQ